MNADELVELLADRPFRPLRVHLADGRSHVIRHPELAVVARSSVTIGTIQEEQNGNHVADKISHCSLVNITEVSPA